jgi:chromate transporter
VSDDDPKPVVTLSRIALDWTRIGITGFGGPPVHIALLRRLVVDRRGWIDDREFEDAIAACNLLPGPASTQLAIFCARRVRGVPGAIVGGLGFIVPAVSTVTALSALFLARSPPAWVRGAGAGAGAAVAAVAVDAAMALLKPSWVRTSASRARRVRWGFYAAVGVLGGSVFGAALVLGLLGCGLLELVLRSRAAGRLHAAGAQGIAATLAAAGGAGGLGALAWVAFKVGALSYGGGFVIVPLMGGDAVHTYHWMSSTQFLSAVALGQITPGPVVATVAAVGYAARGLGGAALAAAIAFSPSFLFVLLGGGQFERVRHNRSAQAFLDGAGPAAIGAILGAAIPLAAALQEAWQVAVLVAAALALLAARRAIVPTLLTAGAVGAVVGITGGPLPR